MSKHLKEKAKFKDQNMISKVMMHKVQAETMKKI